MKATRINLETVGGKYTDEDLEFIHKRSLEEQLWLSDQKLLETYNGRLIQDYPKLKTGVLRPMPAQQNEFYSQLSYQNNEINGGDLCFSTNYAVEIPKDEKLREMISKYGEQKEVSLESILSKVVAVYRGVKDCCRHPNGTVRSDANFMLCSMANRYEGKVVPLESVLTGELPGACFEKAITLQLALQNDGRLKALGIRSYLGVGTFLSEDKKAYGHAWVKLEVPSGLGELGFEHTEYILDASRGKIFALDKNLSDYKEKYVEYPEIDDGLCRIYRQTI